jgi:transcriptional regulator with XRE-family HTH domain
MTPNQPPKGFVRGNDCLAHRLADPDTAARVGAIIDEMDADDRAYRMNLTTVRRAGELTQDELAKRMGVTQGVVSRVEKREDMLYSTLLGYLHAAGVQDVILTATVGGRRVEIVLATSTPTSGLAAPPEALGSAPVTSPTCPRILAGLHAQDRATATRASGSSAFCSAVRSASMYAPPPRSALWPVRQSAGRANPPPSRRRWSSGPGPPSTATGLRLQSDASHAGCCSAWLVLAVTRFNLTRAIGAIASPFHARAHTATSRRHLIPPSRHGWATPPGAKRYTCPATGRGSTPGPQRSPPPADHQPQRCNQAADVEAPDRPDATPRPPTKSDNPRLIGSDEAPRRWIQAKST